MPIFEFVCNDCGESFEELVRSETENPHCPKCGSGGCQRKLSAPSPLKTGAFPYKPGAPSQIGGACRGGMGGMPGCGACGH